MPIWIGKITSSERTINVLYLAEVQKQRSGFKGLGGGKAELKLLACQRGEHNWSAISIDDVIPVEEANKFNDGTLVLVELSASKQVQRIQEAARQLVSILQNFSRLQDKFKDKEEEIEQWKASLTFFESGAQSPGDGNASPGRAVGSNGG
jgi:hypothetical protein